MTNPPKLLLLQVQGPHNHWLYKEGPHWPFFLHIHAEQFTPQIRHIFSCVQTALYNTQLQSLQPAFLRCFYTLWGKAGSSGVHSWNELTLWKRLSLLQQRWCDRAFRWNTAWRYSNRQTAQRVEMYFTKLSNPGFPTCIVHLMMQHSEYKNSFSAEIL